MELISKYKSNIWKVYVISILGGLAFFYNAIDTLYYPHFGLSFQQIGTLFSATLITILILEIPTGSFADVNGKKKSLLIASALYFIATTIISFGSTFPVFLLGFILAGIGVAFNSGAGSAFLYDSLKKLGRESEFAKHRSRLSALFISIDILSGFLGPILFGINPRIPYFISAIFAGTVFLLNTSLFEEKISASLEIVEKESFKLIKNMTASLKLCFKSRFFLWITLLISLYFISNKFFSEVISGPFLVSNGFTLQNLSIIALIANPMQVISAWFAHKLENKLGQVQSFALVIISIPAALLIFALSKNLILTGIALGLFYGASSFREIITEKYLSEHANDENRATVLSISSMITSTLALISLPVLGRIVDNTALDFGVFMLVALQLGVGLFLLLEGKFRKII